MFSNNYILTKDFLFSYPQTIIHDLKIVQIDKARELGYTNNELERWLKFIAAKSSNERADIAKGDELLVELNEWIHKYVADDKTQEELNKWDLEIAENKGYEQGVEQGIEQGIEQKAMYNVPIRVDTIRRRYPIKWTCQEGIGTLIVNTKIWVF